MGTISRPSFLQELKSIENFFRRQKTVSADKVLLLYREPGVLGEYRPPGRSWSYYLASIFQIHNESINICSHAIAIVLFIHRLVVCLAELDGLTDAARAPFVAFGICALAYATFSTLAHTFHSKTPVLHYVSFQFDYAGVGAYGLGTSILLFYSSCPKTVFKIMEDNLYIIPINLVLAWLVMAGCCIAKLRYKRPYPFQRKLWQLGSGILHALFLVIPVFTRYVSCWNDSECQMSSMNHHTVWICSKLASFVFFSSHLPERWLPGKCDFLGQGHQIFHVLIAFATLKQFDAAYYDVMNPRDVLSVGFGDPKILLFGVMVYFLGAVVILCVLSPFVRRRVEQDLKTQ